MNKPNKLQQLEGLRGFAAVVVLMVHLRNTFFYNLYTDLTHTIGPFLATVIEGLFDGDFAVWLFWVMSAFVLSLKFHETSNPQAANNQLTDATIRRYPRLALPVVVSVIFAWLCLTNGLMTQQKLADQFGPDYQKWLGSFYHFSPDLLLALKSAFWNAFFFYQEETTYNSSLWTMEIELYGSFFLFAMLVLFGKFPKRNIIYLIIIAIAFALKMNWINAFVLGNLLSEWYVKYFSHTNSQHSFVHRIQKSCDSKLLLAFLLIPTIYAIGLPNYKETFHLLLAFLVTFYVSISKPAIQFFSHRILTFLGKISFGLYLIHFPIICLMAYPTYNFFLGYMADTPARLVSYFSIAIVSLIAGWTLWYIADRPAIAFSRMVSSLLNSKPKTQTIQEESIPERKSLEASSINTI